MNISEKYFQEIYNTFHEKIRRYLTRMVGEHEADDLSQEVFIKIAQGLTEFRGDSQISTLIYKIATNTAYDRLRRKKVFPVITQSPAKMDVDGSKSEENDLFDETEGDTEQKIIREEMNGCIREIIETLPDAYRSVIILSELENMKDQEIAEILDLTLHNTKIRLHRARTRLRKDLESACVFYRNGNNVLACDRKCG